MPNRILKESITTSATLAKLSAEEERFFYRLLVIVDDYGRIDGRPAILRARCFPLALDVVKDARVAVWLDALVQVGLVQRYTICGADFLQVTTWDRHQQRRAKHSKYPAPPPSDGIGNHVLADAEHATSDSSEERGSEESRSEERESEKTRAGSTRATAALRAVTRASRAERATRWPEAFTLTESRAAFALEGGLDGPQEFAAFRDHHVAKGSRFVDWEAAWRQWCRRSYEFAQSRLRLGGR